MANKGGYMTKEELINLLWKIPKITTSLRFLSKPEPEELETLIMH